MNIRSLRRAAARLVRRTRQDQSLVITATGREAANLPDALKDALFRSLGRGHQVELLILDFAWDAAPAVPEGVAVRLFWRDAVPGVGGFTPPRLDGLSPAPVPTEEGEWGHGYYRDGLPVARIKAGSAGKQIDVLTPWGAIMRRHELDDGGRLARIIDVDPETGDDVTHRYIADNGSCWLSVPLDATGPGGPVRQFMPAAHTYSTLTDVHATWVRTRLPQRSSVRAAGPSSDQVVKRLRRATG